MQSEAPIFKEIFKTYLAEVAALDLSGKAGQLGVKTDGNTIGIQFFNQFYTITPETITDRQGKPSPHSISVILCKYLLLCPEEPDTDKELVTYKDFRDAAPYVLGFGNTAEKPVSRKFSGQVQALEKACQALGGKTNDLGISCDLSYRFQALPQVPVYMMYNDKDEDFPADCSLLFQRRAASYLDMECLAMIGMVLAEWLARAGKKDISGLV